MDISINKQELSKFIKASSFVFILFMAIAIIALSIGFFKAGFYEVASHLKDHGLSMIGSFLKDIMFLVFISTLLISCVFLPYFYPFVEFNKLK